MKGFKRMSDLGVEHLSLLPKPPLRCWCCRWANTFLLCRLGACWLPPIWGPVGDVGRQGEESRESPFLSICFPSPHYDSWPGYFHVPCFPITHWMAFVGLFSQIQDPWSIPHLWDPESMPVSFSQAHILEKVFRVRQDGVHILCCDMYTSW